MAEYGEHTPRAREVAEAAAILQTSGAPVTVSVLDCRAYYKRFGRQLAELWRNGAVSAGGYTVDGRCCFGSAADATKCTRFSNVIVHEIHGGFDEGVKVMDRLSGQAKADRRDGTDYAGSNTKFRFERIGRGGWRRRSCWLEVHT